MVMVCYGHQDEKAAIYMYVASFKIICAMGVERRDKVSALFHITSEIASLPNPVKRPSQSSAVIIFMSDLSFAFSACLSIVIVAFALVENNRMATLFGKSYSSCSSSELSEKCYVYFYPA